MFPMNLKVTSR